MFTAEVGNYKISRTDNNLVTIENSNVNQDRSD